MKMYLVGIILGLAFLSVSANANADDEIYARACAVTGIEYGDDGVNLIIMQDCNGTVFSYWDDEPLYVGDVVSCVFYNNGTEIVRDDIVLNGSYDRPDLLKGANA